MEQKCPFCGLDDTTKAGKKKNKLVTKQMYKCKSCGRRFVERDGFEGMTYPKELIVKVLHLYIEGLSLSKVRDFVYQHEGYKIYDPQNFYKILGLHLQWYNPLLGCKICKSARRV